MLDRACSLVATAILVFAPLGAPAQTVDSLEGTWVLDEVERKYGGTMTEPGPALLVFTRSHVSMTMLRGDSLPSFENPGSPTQQEKAEVYDRLSAVSGPYRVRGDTLVVRPYVSKRPRAMEGWPDRTETFRFGVDGDRLQLLPGNATLTFRRVQGRLGEGASGEGRSGPETAAEERDSQDGAGTVRVDGSSALYPLSEAVAEAFAQSDADARLTLGDSGTRESFSKLCRGEAAVIGVSGPMPAAAARICEANGVEPGRLPVARDGVTLAVGSENDWARCVTLDELRRTWKPGSTVESWQDVRDSWPDRELKLVGPPAGSGTFDHFTEAVVGADDASRSDYSVSADANVLVSRLAESEGAMGYVPFAYARANRARIRSLAVDDGSGCVKPSRESIESGTYEPLVHTLSIWLDVGALRQRPDVRSFVDFYLETAGEVVSEVGYVPLPPARYDSLRARIESVVEGGGD